jgi:transposase-like protein
VSFAAVNTRNEEIQAGLIKMAVEDILSREAEQGTAAAKKEQQYNTERKSGLENSKEGRSEKLGIFGCSSIGWRESGD